MGKRLVRLSPISRRGAMRWPPPFLRALRPPRADASTAETSEALEAAKRVQQVQAEEAAWLVRTSRRALS